MATNQLMRVIKTLRDATLPLDEATATDGLLLERYIRSREETAFAELVHRHGPMVWGVCRRVLRSHQDAEDAFQATFLVLVRKAASIVSKELVANWLYGVAHQTALKARAVSARRGTREKQVTPMPEPALVQPDLWDHLQTLLDQELSCLPDKYRAVIALCDLEGKTRKEVARQLRLPEGTVASRLAAGRTMLGKRLARHGLPVTGAALAAVLAQHAATASVPLSVTSSTIQAATLFAAGPAAATGVISVKAVALAEGVLKTMLLTKLKFATAVLVMVAILGAGTAALTQQVLADKPPDLASRERQRPEAPVDKPAAQPVQSKQLRADKPADQPAKENKADKALPTVVSGIAKAVDADKNTVTVAHREGESTFSVANDAEINIDGKPGKLVALPAGASVHLRQFVDARTTRSVQAEGRWFWGVLKAVDAANNTITFGDKAQDGAAGKTFVVPTDMVVSIDGKPGKLPGIPTGASVNVNLYADQTTVRSLSAEGAQVNGLAKAVDVQNRTITVNDTTYPVAPDVHVGIDHQPGKLEGVPAGANVSLNLRVDQKTVLRISAGGSSIFGTVKAVDAQNNTITVAGQPQDRTYRVTADTQIAIDGKPGKLADIPPGAGLHALNLRVDQQTAHGINVLGPGYHHVGVQAVDAEKNTITLDDKAPASLAGKTLAVAPDANIEIDGKPGKLAGIPAGAFVNLGLSVDSQTARNLQAEGPNLGDCGGSPVSAVDAMNGTITFDDKAAPAIAGKTFSVARDAWIQIDDRPGKLAELPIGSHVNITLTVDRQSVRSLGAQGPGVSGAVTAVDTQKNTITVDARTFTVASDAVIVIGTKPGRVALAELPTGESVNLRLRVDQQTVHMIHVKAP